MLNLEEIKQTRVYQDAKEEGKLEQKIAQIPKRETTLLK